MLVDRRLSSLFPKENGVGETRTLPAAALEQYQSTEGARWKDG